jgi:hypothetical protein
MDRNVVKKMWYGKIRKNVWWNILKYVLDGNGEPFEFNFEEFKTELKRELRPFVAEIYAQTPEQRRRTGMVGQRKRGEYASYIRISKTQGLGELEEISITYRETEDVDLSRYVMTLTVRPGEGNNLKLVSLQGFRELQDINNIVINTVDELVSAIIAAVYTRGDMEPPERPARVVEGLARQTQKEIDREMEELHPGTMREAGRETVSRGFRELTPEEQEEIDRQKKPKKKKRKIRPARRGKKGKGKFKRD